MTEDILTLNQVPEHFFDKEEWHKYSANFPNREKLLESLEPENGALIFMRWKVMELHNTAGMEARKSELIYKQGQSLVDAFKNKLINKEIIATGLQPPSIERKQIPSELWMGIIPNFLSNKAKGDGFEFIHIQLSAAENLQNKTPDIIKQCADWLSSRRAEYGEEFKKTLREKALESFGKNLTTRDFDSAYKRVFGRSRGRPPLKRKK